MAWSHLALVWYKCDPAVRITLIATYFFRALIQQKPWYLTSGALTISYIRPVSRAFTLPHHQQKPLVLALLAFCCTTITTALFASAISHTPILRSISGRRDNNDAHSFSSSFCRTSWASSRHHHPLSSTLPKTAATRISPFTLFSSKPPTPDFFKGAPSTPG